MGRDAERELRAARRRVTYSGDITRLGDEKPALYSGKTALERLALQTALVERLARLQGPAKPTIPRAEWPGEVFDIDERNRRTG